MIYYYFPPSRSFLKSQIPNGNSLEPSCGFPTLKLDPLFHRLSTSYLPQNFCGIKYVDAVGGPNPKAIELR